METSLTEVTIFPTIAELDFVDSDSAKWKVYFPSKMQGVDQGRRIKLILPNN